MRIDVLACIPGSQSRAAQQVAQRLRLALKGVFGVHRELTFELGEIRLQHVFQHHAVSMSEGITERFFAVVSSQAPMAIHARLLLQRCQIGKTRQIAGNCGHPAKRFFDGSS
ncbi:MAG: hypothetical protein DMG62_22455 [Acidobacteria bacterium]|nr:MAG: hypothetical protein DMG62_22455 [Acidobacteriota bacterium]